MLRFLPAIILIQLATGVLIYALITAPLEENQLLAIALLGLIMSVLAAFWFASIAGHLHKDSLAKTAEKHAIERESIRVDAERQKTRIVEDTHKQITKATNRAHAKANFKVGAILAAAIGMGSLMLFTQFLTIGLLILTTSGGALIGYLTRLRQERKTIPIISKKDGLKQIEAIEPDAPPKV